MIAGGETLFDYRDYRTRWEQRVVELGIEPVVLGPVAHDALPALVAAAGVFAFPSTKEGFGLAAMEALAARYTWSAAAQRHLKLCQPQNEPNRGA